MEANKRLLDSTMGKQELVTAENITFKKLEFIYAYALLAIGFCFIHFVVFNVTGFFTTLFFEGTVLLCLIYLKKNNYKLARNHIVMLALLIVFGIVFSITANNFIKFLNIIFLLFCGIYWIYAVCMNNKKIERFFFFYLIEAVFVVPFASFGKEFQVITYSNRKSKLIQNAKLALIGLIAALPLTLVITMLLTSVDSGLEELLNALFGNLIESGITYVLQFVIGIPVASYIFGMLYSYTNRIKIDTQSDRECEKTLERIKLFPNMVMYSAVTPICILYAVFFILQLRYFTSAFSGILPEAYSYAQYARRGFFELFAITIINLMILLIMNFVSKQSGENKPVSLKVYSVLISIFTLLIIATALSKMILYIHNYGLTRLRVYTTWFMILLTIEFVLIIIKQFRFKFNFVKYTVVAFVLLFGVLCFSNVDGNIARFNIEMYKEGNLNNLDVEALCNLSDDGVVYVLKEGIDTSNYIQFKLEDYNNNVYSTYNFSSLEVKRLLERK